MSRILLLTFASSAACLVGIACGDDDATGTPTTGGAAPTTPEESAREASLDRARALAKKLGGGLEERLVGAMADGGPASAVRVCADEARSITRAAAGPDESVGRSSTKLRNPDNAGPQWVRDWLAAQGEGPASEATPLAEVRDGRARVIVPIAIKGVCLSCHGSPSDITPEVSAVLDERYPDDRAVGYGEGELRGALWADVPAS